MAWLRQWSPSVGWIALVSMLGCEAHGLVGSNVSAAFEADDHGANEGGHASTGGADGATSSVAPDDGQGDGGGGGGHASTTDGFIFDVGPGDGPAVCLAPYSSPCDDQQTDPWSALGIGCRNDASFVDLDFDGNPLALYVQEGSLGTSGVFSPREGDRMVILSTGRAADIPRTSAELGCNNSTLCPSTVLEPFTPPLSQLPDPIDVSRVHTSLTCSELPFLVGTGDCSNTLQDQWNDGAGAYDYAELRMTAKVPEGADAFIYEFAFMTAEYPLWAGSQWNDMFVAWLESEAWTGNISFDEMGNPISINGVFLDYLDAPSPLCDHGTCVSPELDGFSMDGHAATRWLETVAPVVPGETIEVVFAVFDMSDASFDTAVLLDGVHWGCTDLPPLTAPTG